MYDIHQISDKPILLEPPNQKPNRFNQLISRASGFVCLVVLVGMLGYLVVPLMTSSQTSGCNVTGSIPIHEAFQPIYQEHCLTMGAPISRIGEDNVQGYGPRTVQYFEGALLMADIAGNADSVEVFPLGRLLAPENGAGTQAVSNASREAFNQHLESNGISEFLGQPITGLVQVDGVELAYFENGGLIWDASGRRTSAHSLGLMHMFNNNPQLMIDTAYIPTDTISRSIFDAIPEYAFDMHVAHPVLYSGEQQVVTIEVVNAISNSPVNALSLNGTVYFADLGESINQSFTLQATDEPGIYTAQINLPQHPEGNEGRDVLIQVSYRTNTTDVITTIKKFQTWW